jgi:PAS domain S-box-containing protein
VHPEEFTQLFNTILINVTAFFRDAAAWTCLATEVIPRITAGEGADQPLRVWSASCASGEEAYTLAIVLAEHLGLETFRRRVKIYATDVDEDALLQGRQASYSARDLNLEGLQKTLEELYIAEEELRQQNEELTATHLAVEAERQRYRELFDLAPDGYLVTDAMGTIREANRVAAALLAVHQDHLVGKPLIVFVTKKQRRSFGTRLAQLPQRERVKDWEVCLQPRGGTPFYAAITVAAVRDPQGTLVGLRWLLRDITARKASSESIQQLRARLAAEQQRLESLV